MSGYSSPVAQPQSQSFQAMKLSELLGYIKGVINNAFVGTYWITAEVSNINQSAHNGHVYFDLVETQSGVNKAFIRGNLWASRASQVLPRFYQVTGGQITIGMELMLLVKVEMHPQYGLSLTIFDINPEYTLGHLERLRQETINKLKADGIWDLNRQQRLPILLQRLAIITSSTAAGWGDFQKQISQNPVGGLLKITLFSSMMQGAGTTKSISNALDQVANNLADFDAVVIIRGGGSKMDLSAFDDYHLCCLIANFPLPIITGIGHEKDVSVADMVAHSPHKTPTAVADFLLRRMEQVVAHLFGAEERLESLLTCIEVVMSDKITFLSNQSQIVLGQIERTTIMQNLEYRSRLTNILKLRISTEGHRIDRFNNQINYQVEMGKVRCSERLQAINYHVSRLTQYLSDLPNKLSEQINLHERVARLYDPQNIMKRGFLPVLKGDKPVQSIDDLHVNEKLRILMLDGELIANVETLTENNHE